MRDNTQQIFYHANCKLGKRQNDLHGQKSRRWTIYTSPPSDINAIGRSASTLCLMDATERNRYLGTLRQISLVGARAHLLQPERLLCVAQYNLILAMASNASALGLVMEDLRDDIPSPFNNGGAAAASFPGLPPALRPTAAQRQITHHPWIDLCPSPEFRDALLKRSEEYDEEALCAAMAGSVQERPGLLIWGSAWDPAAYEMTEHFIQRYGWLFRGCVDFLASTNYWRRKRGEAALSLPSGRIRAVTYSDGENT